MPGSTISAITSSSEGLDPVLLLLVVIILVVLLLPIAVLIGTAVRFGGEHRDRRLAALRLVGADRQMAARIAAGEALVSALLGLAAGALFFLVGRQFVGQVSLQDISVFPADVRPDPALAVLILLGGADHGGGGGAARPAPGRHRAARAWSAVPRAPGGGSGGG